MNTSFKKTTGGDAPVHISKTTNIHDVQKEIASAEFVLERDERRKLRDLALAAAASNMISGAAGAGEGAGEGAGAAEPRALVVNGIGASRPDMHNNSRKKTICLNMIVKNEAHVITETLDNLYSFIKFDYYVVSDTGSSDNTKELIAAFFEKHSVPGEIHDHEWRDFGHNRTLALQAAYNKADYSFIFDADDKICGEFYLPPILRADSYQFKFGNGFNYLRTLMVNSRQKWIFKGVLHEFITSLEPTGKGEILTGEYFIESGRRGARNQVANKYLNDARILERGFDDELAKGDRGMASRYAFYCAQSYKDGGSQHTDDAIKWYERVLTMDNWSQEKYYSCLMLAELHAGHPVSKDMTTSTKYLFMASKYDPERIEGIATVMEHYRNDGLNEIVNLLYHKYKGYSRNQMDKLFVNQSKYEHCIEYNNSVSAFYIGDAISGYECCKKILTAPQIPMSYYLSTIANIMFYGDEMKKDRNTMQMFVKLDDYMASVARSGASVSRESCELWKALFALNRAYLTRYTSYNFRNRHQKQRRVMITFTTCKRYDLFQQTINSIINQWRDVGQIDFWFCVDDNSSIEERNRMRKNYGWIRYYMKTPEEKGHRESMNIIYKQLNRIRPKYWIHMEDDFLFHTQMDYVEPAIQYLERLKESHGVRQVLFNRNYSETIDDYKIIGHDALSDPETVARLKDINGGHGTGLGAVIHSFKDEPGVSYPYNNCHYWPHYSFRPSIIDVEAVFNVGDFNTENQFFEMDYAHKWVERGYKSAFFNRITNRHIGRLTSERHDKSKANAYELNNEGQFQKLTDDAPVTPVVASKRIAIEEVFDSDSDSDNDVDDANDANSAVLTATATAIANDTDEVPYAYTVRDIEVKVVNLLRREDRRQECVTKFADAGILPSEYAFVEAVDGAQIIPNSTMKRLFQGNDFGSKRGVVGCALSHYLLWKALLEDPNNEFYIIMEDDFELCGNFKRALHGMYDEFMNRDVIFMGYHMFSNKRAQVSDIYNREPSSLKSSSESTTSYNGLNIAVEPLNKDLYIGATHCYSVNKNGAKLLVDYIEKRGIKHGIDYLMKIADNGLECYETQPHLAFADWNEAGKSIDTDIQFDYNAINFDAIEDEYTFFPGLDAADGDIQFIRDLHTKSINEIIEIANTMKDCIAFNTLGFFKHTISLHRLSETPYINASNKSRHGIYIKTAHVAFHQKYADSLVNAQSKLEEANARGGRPLRIGFHNMQLCDRGSTIAMYDYAHYNETLLGNESYIVYDATSPRNRRDVIAKCEKRFGKDRVVGYTGGMLSVEQFIQDADLDAMYIIKFGTVDKFVFQGCPTLVHSVFEIEPHGYRYATVSKYLKDYHTPSDLTQSERDKIRVVPHMIDMPPVEEVRDGIKIGELTDYRKHLGIPGESEAFVIGRYGGIKQFNLPQVHDAIKQFLNAPQVPGSKPVYFLFANTLPFYVHERIRYVNTIYDKYEKAAFILACDAMIHGRSDGETFGLSLGEFAFYNKPIITTPTDEFNAHIDILQDRAIIYKTDSDSLLSLLNNVEDTVHGFMNLHRGNVNGYAEYTPEYAMQQFKEQFLDTGIALATRTDLILDTDTETVPPVTPATPSTPTKRVKVKMLCDWCNSEQLCKEWSNMCERDFIWKNIEITWLDGDDVDYYVIINKPLNESDFYVPERTLVFQMEPTVFDETKHWGTKTWGKWANPDPSVFFHVHDHARYLNNVQWLFRYPLSRLQDNSTFDPSDKLNRVSCVSSRKMFDKGHILRNNLLRHIDDHYLDDKPITKNPTDALQSFINVFGSNNHFNYRAYVGKLPEDNIFYGIKPYKYYFMCENNSEHNYATEKIWEPILCETLCFYWGCPNLADYIDPRAFVQLDMNDVDASMRIMEQAIREDWWSQRIQYIRAAKHKIINELAFFPTLHSLIHTSDKIHK
jgi:GR25 family glycosyltransferase involved in LPS biosynthesis